jgi:hypothetical protein
MAVAKGEYLVEVKLVDGDIKMKIDGLTKGFVKLETGMKKLKQASEDTSSGLGPEGLVKDAGLAGATLTELTRTISDMPYGITAITNNLSQLSTLFITLMAKTKETAFGLGKFGGTVKRLRDQLAGPLGVVLAFQVVITAIDFFAKGSKKAKEDTDKLTDSIEKQTTKINSLAYAEDQLTLKRNKRGLVEKVRLAESGNTLRETVSILRHEFTEFEKFFKGLDDYSDKTVNGLIQDFKELLQLRAGQANIEKELVDANEAYSKLDFTTSDEERDKARRRIILAQRSLRESILRQIEIEKNYNVEISKNSKKLEEYSDNVDNLKVSMDFSELNLEEGLRELDAFDMALGERINFMGQFIVETSEQRIDRMEKESLKFLELLDEELELVGLNEKDKQKIRDYYASLRNNNEKKFIDELVATVQQVTSIFSQATQAAYEADVSIEERRTVLANNQLKERLRNESLSAKQREGINAQIAANEEALQVKRDKIAKRQFENDKKVAIANALVNTYLAATDVLAREKLGLVGKIIAMTAVIGLGLAQVAAIRRQQFVPSAIGAAGGGSGAGASIQAPDFNVVGASETSQLAEAVGGSQGKPIKAFVVGKDISTQQELDRNITTTASIG